MDKAAQLLKSILPSWRWYRFKQSDRISVKGQYARYLIEAGRKTIVITKKYTLTACIQLRGPWHPELDRMIAEYLLIKNDEAQYLRTAVMRTINDSGVRIMAKYIIEG